MQKLCSHQFSLRLEAGAIIGSVLFVIRFYDSNLDRLDFICFHDCFAKQNNNFMGEMNDPLAARLQSSWRVFNRIV